MITIALDKPSYSPGETVLATIGIKMKKPARARSLLATLSCEERHRVVEQKVMDNYDFERERELGGFKETHLYQVTSEHSNRLFHDKKVVSGEKEYSSGEYSVSFVIPPGGPPTSREFGHDGKIHVWKLHVKLDLPLAIDENAEKEVFVEGL